MLTSRLGFTRSEAQPTLFVDLARNVFIAVHVDDAHSCLKFVGEMKQYFTVKVSHPLSASSTQTYVGAQYLRHGDAIWELPTARYVTGMLNGHGMQNAEPVVTLAVNRNNDDDESEEASAEEHRSLRRIHCGQESVLGTATPRHRFPYEPSGEVSGMSFKIGHHCVEASLVISARYAGSRTEAASAKQSGLNSDSVHRQRLGWRSTHAQVRVLVGNRAGWIPDQCRCPNTVCDCSIVM